ncbi:MAG: hypothetical protein AAGF12_07945 [Myxococcota bacterium]
MNVHRLLVLALLTGGVTSCVTADGDVLRSTDGGQTGDADPDAATCGTRTVLATGETRLGTSTLEGEPIFTYQANQSAFVGRLGADGTLAESVAVGSTEWASLPVPAAIPGGVRLAVQNHAFAGDWRVYVGDVMWDAGWSWDRFAPTAVLPGDCTSPLIAEGHGGFGVAHRCGRAVVFARYGPMGNQERITPSDTPTVPPNMRRLLATDSGWLVLLRRNRLEVNAFSADGSAVAGGLEIDGDVSDLVAGPVLLTSDGARLELRTLSERGEILGAPEILGEGYSGLDRIVGEVIGGQRFIAWHEDRGVFLAELSASGLSNVREVSSGQDSEIALVSGPGRLPTVLLGDGSTIRSVRLCE